MGRYSREHPRSDHAFRSENEQLGGVLVIRTSECGSEGTGREARYWCVASTQEDLIAVVLSAGVEDELVLDALMLIPRAEFVPDNLVDRAYVDEPLPIPHGQVTTQPSLVAKMIEALDLDGSEGVLEVGTGFGFQTALLARLARFVWSIERWPDLVQVAAANLTRHGTTNVRVLVGDGTAGLAEQAPFDAIVVSAAYPAVPSPLVEQLAPGGKLIQPIGSGGNEIVTLFQKKAERLVPVRSIVGARFVKLYGAHGFPGRGDG